MRGYCTVDNHEVLRALFPFQGRCLSRGGENRARQPSSPSTSNPLGKVSSWNEVNDRELVRRTQSAPRPQRRRSGTLPQSRLLKLYVIPNPALELVQSTSGFMGTSGRLVPYPTLKVCVGAPVLSDRADRDGDTAGLTHPARDEPQPPLLTPLFGGLPKTPVASVGVVVGGVVGGVTGSARRLGRSPGDKVDDQLVDPLGLLRLPPHLQEIQSGVEPLGNAEIGSFAAVIVLGNLRTVRPIERPNDIGYLHALPCS